MLTWELKNIITLGFLIGAFGLGIFYPDAFLLTVVTIVAVFISAYTFINERRKLKHAYYYVRTKPNKVLRIVFLLIYISVFILCFTNNTIIPAQYIEKGFNGYVIVILLSTILSDYYDNFSNSIRTNEKGIVIPGFIHKVFHWNELKGIGVDNNIIDIALKNGKHFSFYIDTKDLADVENIQKQLEQLNR